MPAPHSDPPSLRRGGGILLVVLFAWAPLLAAGGERLVLDARPQTGEKTHITSESKTTRRLVVRDGERAKTDEALQEKAFDYVREIAAVDTSGRVLEERRVFARARLKDERGEPDESLAGKTLTLKRRSAAFEPAQPPLGKLALELLEELKLEPARRDGVFAPVDEVSEGASWDLDLGKALEALDATGLVSLEELDRAASSARVRVVRLERRDGVLGGKLEVDVKGKTVKELPNLGPVERSGLSIVATIEGCLDGTRPDRTVTVEAVFEVVTRIAAGKTEHGATLEARRTTRLVRSAAP
jgi:hypothetical protein